MIIEKIKKWIKFYNVIKKHFFTIKIIIEEMLLFKEIIFKKKKL